jgi:hypothetical protein
MLQADATRCHHEFGSVDELSSRFFDGMGVNDDVRHQHFCSLVLFLICALSRPQRVVLTLIPLQMHSSLAWPRSSTIFDPTVLSQTNLCNLERSQDCIYACSSLACRRSFAALYLNMMHQTNCSNPPRLHGYIYMSSSLAYPHFSPALNSTQKTPNLIP